MSMNRQKKETGDDAPASTCPFSRISDEDQDVRSMNGNEQHPCYEGM